MKKSSRFVSLLLLTLLLSLLLPTTAFANAAEPPSLTIIVPDAPSDLTLSIQWDNQDISATTLLSEDKVLEQYYRFYNYQIPNDPAAHNTLVVESRDYNFTLSLSDDQLTGYSNLMTLDLDAQTLTPGQAPFRTAFYVAMRVLLTLVIEGAIFYAFGFRDKRSWIAFLLINLVTQGGLNLCLTGPDLGRTYWEFSFIFLEILVLLTELIAFPRALRLQPKSKMRIYVVVANLTSLVAGGYFIANLPV